MKIDESIIKPIMMSVAELMTMFKKHEEKLKIIKRKILWTMLGTVKIAENEYKVKRN